MTPQTPFFEVKNLSHSFGGLRAVSEFCLSVERGATWGIIGPNGAGKTTVFNLLTGVYRPDEGSVKLDNENLAGLPSHAIIAKGVARTFQNIRLFKSMTVLENVLTAAYCRAGYGLWDALCRAPRFGRSEARLRDSASEVLEAFGLGSRIDEPAASLPYGMQRKVELARALAAGPSLLLLDEPGAGMNHAELGDLADLVAWVREKFRVSVVLIEHRMQLVTRLCDKVKVLNFGRTIFEGRPDELGRSEAVVKAYFGEDHVPAVN